MMKQDLELIEYAKTVGVDVSQVSRMQDNENFDEAFCSDCQDKECNSCFVVTY